VKKHYNFFSCIEKYKQPSVSQTGPPQKLMLTVSKLFYFTQKMPIILFPKFETYLCQWLFGVVDSANLQFFTILYNNQYTYFCVHYL